MPAELNHFIRKLTGPQNAASLIITNMLRKCQSNNWPAGCYRKHCHLGYKLVEHSPKSRGWPNRKCQYKIAIYSRHFREYVSKLKTYMEYRGNNKLCQVPSGQLPQGQIDAFARMELNWHRSQCNYKCESIQRDEIWTFPLCVCFAKLFSLSLLVLL